MDENNMDILHKELKYIEKIQNDVDERLFDLLIMHIQKAYKKIRVHGEDNEDVRIRFMGLLDKSLHILETRMNKFNKLQTFRAMLLICNTLLIFDTKRYDILDLKKHIIEEYTQSDADEHGYIPINYQINEVRITYDVSYLTYLIEKYISLEKWNAALYCLIAVELVEPDYEKIDTFYDMLHSNISEITPKGNHHKLPFGKKLALDTNVAMQMLFGDIGKYRFPISYTAVDIVSLSNDNEIIVTDSVLHELEDFIRYKLVGIKKLCYNKEELDYNTIEKCLYQRLDAIRNTYGYKIGGLIPTINEEIVSFYCNYPKTLEEITRSKLEGLRISHKLRKLAHRVAMLPETGDMALLSEIISLKKSGIDISIYSSDKDFTTFSEEIESTFGIEIYSP